MHKEIGRLVYLRQLNDCSSGLLGVTKQGPVFRSNRAFLTIHFAIIVKQYRKKKPIKKTKLAGHKVKFEFAEKKTNSTNTTV